MLANRAVETVGNTWHVVQRLRQDDVSKNLQGTLQHGITSTSRCMSTAIPARQVRGGNCLSRLRATASHLIANYVSPLGSEQRAHADLDISPTQAASLGRCTCHWPTQDSDVPNCSENVGIVPSKQDSERHNTMRMPLKIVPAATSQSERARVFYSGAREMTDRLARRSDCTIESRGIPQICHHSFRSAI